MGEDETKAERYSKIKDRLTLAELGFTFAFLIFIILSGVSIWLKGLIIRWTGNLHTQIAIYLTFFCGIFYVLSFVIDFYDGFVVEHRFSLSNQTFLGWFKESLKKDILGFGLFLLVVELIYLCLERFPASWWIFASIGWIMLTIVLSKLAPVLIIPLFYKCKPMRNLDLKERLVKLAKFCGAPINEVFEINLSKDTKKANAALSGMGSTRRIILSDTLLSSYSDEEIEVVVAHEIAHLRMLHIWKLLGVGGALTVVGLYLTHLLLERAVVIFGFDGTSDIAAFPLLALILLVLGLIIMPIQNGFSRYLERRADSFALQRTKATQPFISAITKLGQQNLRDPTPRRWKELLLYDHPPISKRIEYAKGLQV